MGARDGSNQKEEREYFIVYVYSVLFLLAEPTRERPSVGAKSDGGFCDMDTCPLRVGL